MMRHSSDSWLVDASMRLYAVVIRAYPSAFTHEYGEPMCQLFADSCRSAMTEHGLHGVLGVWIRTLADLATSLPTEYVVAWAAPRRASSAGPRAAVDPHVGHLTPHAQRVVAFARTEARAFQHPAIGPEHLLLGLINQPGGSVAARALHDLGVKLPYARAAVEFIAGVGDDPSTDRPLTVAAQLVLATAAHEAVALQHRYVGPEHVLLALVTLPDTGASAVFELMGLPRDMVRTAVLRLLRAGEAPAGAVRPMWGGPW